MKKYYTDKDVEAECSGPLRERIYEEAKKYNSTCGDGWLIFEVGEWLGIKLIEQGATKAEKKSICFALGQLLRMSGLSLRFVAAAHVYNRFLDGARFKEGRDFGKELIKAFFPL